MRCGQSRPIPLGTTLFAGVCKMNDAGVQQGLSGGRVAT